MDNLEYLTKFEQNQSIFNNSQPSENTCSTIEANQFDKICRTCLANDTDCRSIHDVIYDNLNITYFLENYVSIQIYSTDYLPQKLCSSCISELIRFHIFRQKCKENETLLKNIHEKHDDENKEKSENKSENNSEESFSNGNTSDSEHEEKSAKTVNTRLSSQKGGSRKKKKTSFKCRDCKEVCASKESLQQHRREAKHPEGRMHACTECGKMFTGSKLRQHMRAHTKEKPYVCDVCSQGFSMSGNLKRHMMTHTGERPHVCEICGKGFIQATTLVNHRRTHTNTKKTENNTPNFICDYCGRGFKRLARYNAHLKRHFSDSAVQRKIDLDEEIREYVCDICKRAYKTKHLLKAHQLTHGEKSFLCSECGKGFVTKAALQSHLKVHTGEKPHTCNVCKKSFAHVGSFEAHMLIHTGQKPYNCNICTKAFTQLSHLKYHKRTHSGERPYVCSYCGKSFALKGNLTVHVRIHTGETPYTCPVCGKGFYDSSSMKKHRRGHVDINVHINQQIEIEVPALNTQHNNLSYVTNHEMLNPNLHDMQIQIDHGDIICKY